MGLINIKVVFTAVFTRADITKKLQAFSSELVRQFAAYVLQDALAISEIVLVPIVVGLLEYSVPSTFIKKVTYADM